MNTETVPTSKPTRSRGGKILRRAFFALVALTCVVVLAVVALGAAAVKSVSDSLDESYPPCAELPGTVVGATTYGCDAGADGKHAVQLAGTWDCTDGTKYVAMDYGVDASGHTTQIVGTVGDTFSIVSTDNNPAFSACIGG